MRIHNVRLGHACNSSSTHSILIIPKGGQLPTDNPEGGWQFGWGNFTLTSKLDKAAYIWAQMAAATTPAIADLILLGAGIKKPNGLGDADADEYDTAYVDHQSQMSIPYEYDESMPSVEYAQDLAKFMMQPNAVILGGNDNSEGHPLVQAVFGGDDEAREFRYQHDEGRYGSLLRRTSNGGLFSYTDDLGGHTYGAGKIVARKDGPMWTLFGRGNGNRMSVTFDDSDLPERLDSPMLVDIKLTDYCDVGCPFCYQDSTVKGEHADSKYVESLLYRLHNLKCFEVAFGGGEPTKHPDFGKFVTMAREYNIVPNVTSRNPAWFTSKRNQKAVKAMGAIAFSAETLSQLMKWDPFIKAREYTDPDLTVQVIDGAVKETELKKIAAYAHENRMRVTVLGWKTTGRANEFKLRDQGKWLDWYKGLTPYEQRMVAVDTVIVQQYKDKFEEMGVAPESYIDHEGRWSCYIDAVNKVIAPSSYGLASETKALTQVWGNDLVEAFRALP